MSEFQKVGSEDAEFSLEKDKNKNQEVFGCLYIKVIRSIRGNQKNKIMLSHISKYQVETQFPINFG